MSELSKKGHPLGLHRVLDSEVRLPQAAMRLDNSLPIVSNEVLLSVKRLNIDAASFVQMEESSHGDEKKIAQVILENCRQFGKQQNRVTGSGGMLLGEVIQIGKEHPKKDVWPKGTRLATLVSLTTTPLHLERVLRIDKERHQVEVEGHAILFERTMASPLPKDLPESLSLALFDVAGAPATVHHFCKKGQTLVVVGAGGKAGLLSCAAGRKKMGPTGKIIAIEPSQKAARDLISLKVCDAVYQIDARDPLAVAASVAKATRDKMADIVINVASVPDTELSCVLSAKARARVIYFSMATSFTRVALGAEALVSDAQCMIGNGYFPHHADFVIRLIRQSEKLKKLFLARYS